MRSSDMQLEKSPYVMTRTLRVTWWFDICRAPNWPSWSPLIQKACWIIYFSSNSDSSTWAFVTFSTWRSFSSSCLLRIRIRILFHHYRTTVPFFQTQGYYRQVTRDCSPHLSRQILLLLRMIFPCCLRLHPTRRCSTMNLFLGIPIRAMNKSTMPMNLFNLPNVNHHHPTTFLSSVDDLASIGEAVQFAPSRILLKTTMDLQEPCLLMSFEGLKKIGTTPVKHWPTTFYRGASALFPTCRQLLPALPSSRPTSSSQHSTSPSARSVSFHPMSTSLYWFGMKPKQN